jgi:hypothetical protein
MKVNPESLKKFTVSLQHKVALNLSDSRNLRLEYWYVRSRKSNDDWHKYDMTQAKIGTASRSNVIAKLGKVRRHRTRCGDCESKNSADDHDTGSQYIEVLPTLTCQRADQLGDTY